MRLLRPGLIIVYVLVMVGGISSGCGEAPPCETSLITLDETRLDAETYEEEATETRGRVAELENNLAKKKDQIAAIEDKPAELEKKVRELKKGSGRE
ncbi:MAG: hypothetical protein JSV33_00925 [bacterium]|nr:MAG: hypothetical protein JSV33_00925 [bacterium]